MTQATFQELLNQLFPHWEQQTTNMWQPLPAETWLTNTLLKLATPASLHYVSHLFGMGKATSGDVILGVWGTL